MITLKELCQECNVTRRAIQCYEVKGLISASSRNKMGYLLYKEETIQAVNQIHFYQQIGFSLTEIKSFKGVCKNEMLKHLKTQLPKLLTSKTELDTNISILIDILNERVDLYIL
jgi:DNA-binding transcriptional MerR regulator